MINTREMSNTEFMNHVNWSNAQISTQMKILEERAIKSSPKCKEVDCNEKVVYKIDQYGNKWTYFSFCKDHKCYDSECHDRVIDGFKWCMDHQTCSIFSCDKIKTSKVNYCSDHACKCSRCQNMSNVDSEYCDRCYSNQPDSCRVIGCSKPHGADSRYCKDGEHSKIEYPVIALDDAKPCCTDNHAKDMTMQQVMDSWDDWELEYLDVSAHVY